jgi:membrane protease subunit HflC
MDEQKREESRAAAVGGGSGKIFLGVLLAAILICATLVLYKVDVTEFAIVTQFGNPVRVVKEPGLRLKLPDPIETVRRFDRRVQICQAEPLELLTLDKKSVNVDYYGTWRITDPVMYMTTVRDRAGAEARLLDVFSSALGIQMARYNLENLVNTDSRQLKLDAMMSETIRYARDRASEYGIEVIDAQIKVLNFPESNKQSVYDRMKSEREQMARKYRSEGTEQAAKIRADAEKEEKIILSEAYATAQKLTGEGDAEAIRIYASAFQKDPKFYEFIRTLETYEKTIDGNTTLILPSNAEILKYLSGAQGRD